MVLAMEVGLLLLKFHKPSISVLLAPILKKMGFDCDLMLSIPLDLEISSTTRIGMSRCRNCLLTVFKVGNPFWNVLNRDLMRILRQKINLTGRILLIIVFMHVSILFNLRDTLLNPSTLNS